MNKFIKTILLSLHLVMMSIVIMGGVFLVSTYWVVYFPIWYLKRLKRNLISK